MGDWRLFWIEWRFFILPSPPFQFRWCQWESQSVCTHNAKKAAAAAAAMASASFGRSFSSSRLPIFHGYPRSSLLKKKIKGKKLFFCLSKSRRNAVTDPSKMPKTRGGKRRRGKKKRRRWRTWDKKCIRGKQSPPLYSTTPPSPSLIRPNPSFHCPFFFSLLMLHVFPCLCLCVCVEGGWASSSSDFSSFPIGS